MMLIINVNNMVYVLVLLEHLIFVNILNGMNILQIIFISEILLHMLLTILIGISNFFNKVKKHKSSNYKFSENTMELDSQQNPFILSFILFVFSLFILIRFKILERFNLAILIISFLFLIKYLGRVLFRPDCHSLYTFDGGKSLGFFALIFPTFICFNTKEKLFDYTNSIISTNIHDVVVILLVLFLFFIYFVLIFALIPSILFELNKPLNFCLDINIFVLRMIISKQELCFEKINKVTNAINNYTSFRNGIINIFGNVFKILANVFRFLFMIIIIILLDLIIYFIYFLTVILYFFVFISKVTNEMMLSFLIRIAIILSLLFTFIVLNKYSYLITDVNYKIFEFIDSTVLIPLIYDSINRYNGSCIEFIKSLKTKVE